MRRDDVGNVGRGLNSCTQKVKAVGCLHPDGKGRKVVLIDTPGFDDTERTDYEVLKAIAEWLKNTGVSSWRSITKLIFILDIRGRLPLLESFSFIAFRTVECKGLPTGIW